MDDQELNELRDFGNDKAEDLESLANHDGKEEEWEEDPFTALMFGHGRGRQGQETVQHDHLFQHPQHQPYQPPNIDYTEIMGHVDTLMESARGLKPLFQKIYPFVEQLLKKK
ncbi:hypothetical protein [Neobacillus rhizophilus]|uniref:Uncharacterized protein n=1 Tax=Neobacillus rhizophilus TaxID=2833579 RepID=A0A942U495_9BACI|nr:hypothetical protein [Neobacillus rhizophilus]MBS4212156.1 hypothetical protein [Neobacillus rhizophilus]MBU8915586.1 hypothetical protein [Bacillus sp. FJAT-29953]